MPRKAPVTVTTPHQSLPVQCASLGAKEQKKKIEHKANQQIEIPAKKLRE
ncbi:MAG: hypothetical protein IME94_10070 [Proteobacteria bacterium]|nr:hypothetical protein [Pseudomonadota bacterium]